MKVAIGCLGSVTFALKVSLETLGIEVVIPTFNRDEMHKLSQQYMPSELCYPLKILLGSYLCNKDQKPDAVIYYAGCDLCNLTPISYAYTEIFKELGWNPQVYTCDLNSKKSFISSYMNILKKISGRPWHQIAYSIFLGLKKYEAFNFIDQVFYEIRPAFSSYQESERLYKRIHKDLLNAQTRKEIDDVSFQLEQIFDQYKPQVQEDTLRVGIVGDTYSISEPFTHLYTDKILGELGVVVDRWSKHRCLPESMKKKIPDNAPEVQKVKEIFKNNYGVFTPLELVKLSNYIVRGYDGLIFVQPFECNPNDALRNLLSTVSTELEIPVLSMVFDEHTSAQGVKIRLEAFIDLLSRRRINFKQPQLQV